MMDLRATPLFERGTRATRAPRQRGCHGDALLTARQRRALVRDYL